MCVPRFEAGTHPGQMNMPRSARRSCWFWMVLLAAQCFADPHAIPAQDAPPKKKVQTQRLVIVVPEDADPTELKDVATYKNPDDTGLLFAHWKWKGPAGKFVGPDLKPIDEHGAPDLVSTVLPIRQVPSDTNASYKLVPDQDKEIEPGGTANFTYTLVNANRLQPGVYRGTLEFGMQLSSKAAAGGADPDVLERALEITIVKCGRRLHRVNVWNDKPESPLIAFGRSWQTAVEYDEFIGSNGGQDNAQRPGRPVPGLSELKLSLDLKLTYSNSTPNVARPPISLARISLNKEGLVPPAKPGAGASAGRTPWKEDWPLWKDVYFNISALHEQLGADPKETTGNSLYNSRINVAGAGPKTWKDPVVWVTKRNVPLTGTKLPEYVDHDSKAQWHRKTTEIGLPALDVLGKVTATADLQKPGLLKEEKRSTDHKDVAPGFAIFPQLSVVRDPVELIAATTAAQGRPTSIRFHFRHDSQPIQFDIDLLPDAVATGDGVRFSEMRSGNAPCGCTLGTEGRWIVVAPVDSKDKLPLGEFRANAALQSPALCKTLIFPHGKPAIFDLWFNGALLEEQSDGCCIPDSGKKTVVPDRVSLTAIAGAVESIRYATLEPIHISATTDSHPRFESGGQPLCELVGRNGQKVGQEPSQQLQVLQAPLDYQLQARFGDPGARDDKEKPVLAGPLPAETLSREIEFLIPIVVRAEFGSEDAAQLIFRRFTVRVRNDGDYWIHKVLWVTIFVSIIALSILGVYMIWKVQRTQRAEMLDDMEEDVIPGGAGNSLSANPLDQPQTLAAESPQTTEPMESVDDSPGLL